VLAVNFLELLCRLFRIVAHVQEVETLVVKPVSGLIRCLFLLGEEIEAAAAGGEVRGQQCQGQRVRKAAPPCAPGRAAWHFRYRRAVR
jgi:hypothetical protein